MDPPIHLPVAAILMVGLRLPAPARQVLHALGLFLGDDSAAGLHPGRRRSAGRPGLLARRMVDAGVNVEVLYSDHEHRPIYSPGLA